MSSKRSNNAIWKLVVEDDETPVQTVDHILSRYSELRKGNPSQYQKLEQIQTDQPFASVELQLWVRSAWSRGLLPFLKSYLASEEDEEKFFRSSLDVCLFIATKSSLFAITSGNGYRILSDYVDYSFAFDTAKKLIANNFKEADVREITGPRTGRTETYRYGYSISKSESFGKVWKRLVGRLDSTRLGPKSYLRAIIDPNRPPALELKSSFVLRKSLDLRQLISLVHELEALPEPTKEHALELSFLDSLYPVKPKGHREQLNRRLIEEFRLYLVEGKSIDLDICDPEDVAQYYAGTSFKLGRWPILAADPPEKEHLRNILLDKLRVEILEDSRLFYEKVKSMRLSYLPADEDNESHRVVHELHKYFHAQVQSNGDTYFLLDKIWYRSQGTFLENLKTDFLEETFDAPDRILLSDLPGKKPWTAKDEDGFNRNQATAENYYYGDKIFAVSDRGKIELFDLLLQDQASGVLYVIQVKDGFDAKMRDACSQIATAADVIESDLKHEKSQLRAYYKEWAANAENSSSTLTEEQFLALFDAQERCYVVLAATKTDFTRETFETELPSHIARREVITTRQELKGKGITFRLVHTKKGAATNVQK
ncbi:TIGR04141 family sporadically distributed protein [Amycolatopsis acidiphila]|uniref:DUF6119 family protein n=1 Tax=Amycolatopsis acidiphila TaxID=715473 RepID=UPI0016437064|nr:DUF6119 family protein [Amycolatopsis acidiphila]UIJ59860.1 TIGR04141 family sporadically distributed protein [Amycolatopsis acidiphila]